MAARNLRDQRRASPPKPRPGDPLCVARYPVCRGLSRDKIMGEYLFGQTAMQARGRTRDRRPLRQRRFSLAVLGMSLSLLLPLPRTSASQTEEEEPKASPDAGSPEQRSSPAPEEAPPDDALPQAENPKPMPAETGAAGIRVTFRSGPPQMAPWQRIVR